jgi:hypothetical protein
MSVKQTFFDQETRANIIDYSMEVENLAAPQEVLNRLHDIISKRAPICVQGANRFPTKVGDWRRVELGKNAFVHRSVPRSWTEEWIAIKSSGHRIGLIIARMSVAPLTWTEMTRKVDPVGVDRWGIDLSQKHGMRDGYICPVGGRWAVGFWSPKVLDYRFTQQARGLLYMAASAAAVRLERLVSHDARRIDSLACLTPREQSVLARRYRKRRRHLGSAQKRSAVTLKRRKQNLGRAIARTPWQKPCETC